MVGTGAKTILKYGWAGNAKNKVFGQNQAITGFDRENNIAPLYTLGIRNWNYFTANQYAVRMSVEWVLSNPWFFKAVLGDATTSGAGPYTHTFTVPNPNTEIEKIDIEIYNGDQGSVIVTNAKVASCRISATVGEPARVACDFIGESDTVFNTGTTFVADTFEPYTFAHATLMRGSTTIGYVRSFELTISNELEPIYKLGQRTPACIVEKNLVVNGRMSLNLVNDNNILRWFYGSDTASSPQTQVVPWADVYLKFMRDATNEYISVHLYKVVFDTYSLPQSPTDVIVEDVSFVADKPEVVAVNSVSSIP